MTFNQEFLPLNFLCALRVSAVKSVLFFYSPRRSLRAKRKTNNGLASGFAFSYDPTGRASDFALRATTGQDAPTSRQKPQKHCFFTLCVLCDLCGEKPLVFPEISRLPRNIGKKLLVFSLNYISCQKINLLISVIYKVFWSNPHHGTILALFSLKNLFIPFLEATDDHCFFRV